MMQPSKKDINFNIIFLLILQVLYIIHIPSLPALVVLLLLKNKEFQCDNKL